MDEADIRILKLLCKNSRESLAQMSAVLGISKATISRRISRLESKGIIKNYRAEINLSKLGVMRAVLLIEVVGAALNRVTEELKKFNEIGYAYKLFGDHNLMCEVYIKSVDELYQLIQEKVVKINGIKNVEVNILIDKIELNPDAEFNAIISKSKDE